MHRAAVAERLAEGSTETQTQFQQPAGKGVGIYTGGDGFLYCDSLRIDDIRDKVGPSQRADVCCYGNAVIQMRVLQTPCAFQWPLRSPGSLKFSLSLA